MTIRESEMNVDEDLARVNELYKELKIHRMKRNYQHKLIRGLKLQRDEHSDEVKKYVESIKDLKDKRDMHNILAQEFKTLRDTALTNRAKSEKNDNKEAYERFEKEQNQYHLDMVSKTEEAQQYQAQIDELAIPYKKANKACDAKHQEMLFIREKSQRFHADLTACIEKIEAIKAKYDIDYFEFDQEEE
tara:strand:+ start:427 stop:993 length:567 start_codon:yes stop_codon:yes gene_type:complete